MKRIILANRFAKANSFRGHYVDLMYVKDIGQGGRRGKTKSGGELKGKVLQTHLDAGFSKVNTHPPKCDYGPRSAWV